MESFCSQAYTSSGLKALNNYQRTEKLFSFILKGHPDTLKRELIEKTAASSENECEIYYDYNSQPVSLICRQKNFMIADGTFPNCREPETYGVSDAIIDLGSYQNPEILRRGKDRAMLIFRELRKEENRCASFISAARGIADDCRRLENERLNKPQINRFCAKLWKKRGILPTGKIGTEKKYFADVISAGGTVFPFKKFNSLCKNTTVINDFSSSFGTIIADKIRLYALSCGLDVISFIDFLDTQTVRHIIIPELEYGIYCEKISRTVEINSSGHIRKSRFFLPERTEEYKNRASFCKKAYSELIDEAVKALKSIEALKKQLNSFFLSASDSQRFIADNITKITNV